MNPNFIISPKTLTTMIAPQVYPHYSYDWTFYKIHLKGILIYNLTNDSNLFESKKTHLLISEISEGTPIHQKVKNLTINKNIEVIALNDNIDWLSKGIKEENLINATSLHTKDGIKYALTNNQYKDEAGVKEAVIYDTDRNISFVNLNVPEEITVNGQRYKVVRILSYAFAYLDNLKEITFPKTITKFGRGLLKDNPKLEKITFNSAIANWDKEFVTTSPLLKEINLPDGLTSFNISNELLDNHGALNKIKFNKIRDYRIRKDSLINRITNEIVIGTKNSKIEFGILGIGQKAFKNTEISSINLPSSIKYINDEAFFGSHLSGNIYLNEGLEKIGSKAFANINEAIDLIMPNSIKEIASDAFINSASVTLKFRGNVPSWYNIPSYVTVVENYQE